MGGVSYLHGKLPDGSPAPDNSIKPIRVLIKRDRYKAMLNLPIAFEQLELPKIYALLKILKERPDQNEKVYEILDQFFPAWVQGFFDAFTKAALIQWYAINVRYKVSKTKRTKKALDRCRKIIKAYEAAKPRKI